MSKGTINQLHSKVKWLIGIIFRFSIIFLFCPDLMKSPLGQVRNCPMIQGKMSHTYGRWLNSMAFICTTCAKNQGMSGNGVGMQISVFRYKVCKYGFFWNTTYSNKICGKRPNIQIWISGDFYLPLYPNTMQSLRMNWKVSKKIYSLFALFTGLDIR